jgi:chromosome segregation ATPase
MSEIVLEQRVSQVEKNIIQLGQKMDRYGEDSHERLTRLEDWLIQYSIATQKNIEESQRWRKSMEESRLENERELKELRQSQAESKQKFEQHSQEMREINQRIDNSFEEIQKLRAESNQNFEQHSQEMREINQRIDDGFEQHSQEMREINQRIDDGFKELRKNIADSRKELGQISHRLGTLVEDLVAPSLPRVFREMLNCPADEDVLINVRVRRRHPTQKGKMLEIDAMADWENYVIFNETKSQFTPEKVKAFL